MPSYNPHEINGYELWNSLNYEKQYIGTTFGKTHVLIIGDTKKRKMITLHGGNGISPLNIRIFIPLLEEYCIIAPDVIGMPGKSEPYRNLDTNKDDYGLWLGEIMDNFEVLGEKYGSNNWSNNIFCGNHIICFNNMWLAIRRVDNGRSI